MQVDITPLLATGAGAVLTAGGVLTLLLRRDLAAAMAGGGRLFLGGALGLGVIVFAIKLIILLTLSNFPERTIAPLLRDTPRLPRPAAAGNALPWPAAPVLPPWQALPRRAPVPAGAVTSPAAVALGERLFKDPRLSRDGRVACASCHGLDDKGGADRRRVALGVGGASGTRNTPTVWNAAFQSRLFWDGRARSLEDQAVGPILNPVEMAMPSAEAVEARLRVAPGYPAAFAAAFGDDAVTIGRVAKAIAAFERTLITPDTPYDRFVRGDASALSASQQRGMWLFRAAGCQTCHAGANFSGASLVGPRDPFRPLLAARSPAAGGHDLRADRGRAAAGADIGLWRVPSLRNVALTAPYFHNGSVATLEEAVRIMAEAQLNALVVDANTPRPPPSVRWDAAKGRFIASRRLVLDGGDVADLVAFLRALSDPRLEATAVADLAARPAATAME
jgi:cytochrome c peroxidase